MAATRVVWQLPGMLGSELHLQFDRPPLVGPGTKLWVSPVRLGLYGQIDLLAGELAPAPGPPLDAGRPLTPYYGHQWLHLLLRQHALSYKAVGWGYDWRANLLDLGKALALAIVEEAAFGATDHRIVAHSLGGLVARLAYRELSFTGDQGLIKRLVTLGCPHTGTYGPVRAWSGSDATVRQVADALTSTLIGGPKSLAIRRRQYVKQLSALAATWTSMYQLLPRDPAVLDPAGYPADIGLSAAGLAFHAPGAHEALDKPESVPPADVLTMVAGSGHRTPRSVDFPEDLGRSDRGLGFDTFGDGQVPIESAAPPAFAGRVYYVSYDHHSMPAGTAWRLVEWLWEEGAVNPDPVTIPGKLQPSLPPPPDPSTIWLGPKLGPLDPANPVNGSVHDC